MRTRTLRTIAGLCGLTACLALTHTLCASEFLSADGYGEVFGDKGFDKLTVTIINPQTIHAGTTDTGGSQIDFLTTLEPGNGFMYLTMNGYADGSGGEAMIDFFTASFTISNQAEYTITDDSDVEIRLVHQDEPDTPLPPKGSVEPGIYEIRINDHFTENYDDIIWNLDITWDAGPTSWTVPGDFETIQQAIDAADHGDAIIVAPGTYHETIDFLGKAIHLRSSDGPLVTVIDAHGTGSVITCTSGEGPNTILEGFTITGGTGTPEGEWYRGGGMYNVNSSPTVINCIFEDNAVNDRGAGMYNGNSHPIVTDCIFRNNTAEIHGGGMDNGGGSNPTITNCTFENNSAIWGGGIRNRDTSSPTITECVFVSNTAEENGGGIYNFGPGTASITNSVFENNTAAHGGGMHNLSSNPTIVSCVFENNSALEAGGGLFSDSNSLPGLGESTFCLNTPDQIAGPWTDLGDNVINPIGDLNCDGSVGVPDLLILIGAWGACSDCNDCPADLTGNCAVGIEDLLILIANWG